jgi:hypothetical protein
MHLECPDTGRFIQAKVKQVQDELLLNGDKRSDDAIVTCLLDDTRHVQ